MPRLYLLQWHGDLPLILVFRSVFLCWNSKCLCMHHEKHSCVLRPIFCFVSRREMINKGTEWHTTLRVPEWYSPVHTVVHTIRLFQMRGRDGTICSTVRVLGLGLGLGSGWLVTVDCIHILYAFLQVKLYDREVDVWNVPRARAGKSNMRELFFILAWNNEHNDTCISWYTNMHHQATNHITKKIIDL